jgi:hypothetical protein
MNRDLYNNVLPKQTIVPKTVTVAEDGAGVLMQGYESADLELNCGTQSGTSCTFQWQESNVVGGATGYTKIADADLTGGVNDIAITTANDNQIHCRGYKGRALYVRCICSAATAGNMLAAATVLLGNPNNAPVTH